MTKYFYDSYAVIAYLNDRLDYRWYFEEHDGILTMLNLMEVHYKILSIFGADSAKKVLDAFSKYLVHFNLEDLEESMKLRLKFNKEGLNLSYADALGYYMAKKFRVKFLTGDRAFKGLPNVELKQ
ncbi:MAG: type II toxin-antitoxin system VapC family toxin [Thaumarchaeota archaeon]|nr:type II toxin-antitoxin system VapC family toxin [Nitrososphaerota archaeon]